MTKYTVQVTEDDQNSMTLILNDASPSTWDETSGSNCLVVSECVLNAKQVEVFPLLRWMLCQQHIVLVLEE
jgi:hypothetical protein